MNPVKISVLILLSCCSFRAVALAHSPDTGVNSPKAKIASRQDHVLVTALQSNMEGYTAPHGVDPAKDIPDPRIKFADENGRGANILATSAPNGLEGWTSEGGEITRRSTGDQFIEFTATSPNYPSIHRNIWPLKAGAIYEVVLDCYDPKTQLIVKTQKGFSVFPSAGYSTPDAARRRLIVTRFIANGTSDVLSVAVNSKTTPLGTGLFKIYNVSVRPLTAGIAYPPSMESPYIWSDTKNAPALGTNPAIWAARTLLARGIAKQVIIVPAARGGTGLVGGPWDPDKPGERFTATRALLNQTMSDHPGAVPVLLMVGGEWDATVGIAGVPSSSPAYLTKMSKLIAGLRSVPGASHMQTIMGSMVPEYIAANPQVARIDATQRLLPNRVPAFTFIPMVKGYQKPGEPFHYSAAGARQMGILMGEAVHP